METINVLIADDHPMFVDGLVKLLGDAGDIQILGTATNGEEAIRLAEEYPDAQVLIIDLNMPVLDGVQAARHIHRRITEIRLLALTQNADGGSVSKALKAGVSGYLIKTSEREEFLTAIRTIASGGTYFSEGAKNALVSFTSRREEIIRDNTVSCLSDREKDILKLIVLEFTSHEIAERLHISYYTVEAHRRKMIEKLKVRNTAGLVRIAIQNGLVKVEEREGDDEHGQQP